MPVNDIGGAKGDGYGYDIAINPGKNVMLTSSFTGWNNYMMDLGKLVKDGEAMKRFGNTMVAWDLKAMKPQKVLNVPGAPLEIRWSLKEGDNWAITATALTSKLWLVKPTRRASGRPRRSAPSATRPRSRCRWTSPSAADGKGLWVNTFMDGTTRYFDLSNPEAPKQTYAKQTGKQVNMVSQSWDGKRVYITSSLLANWDKKGEDNEQMLRAFDWDGKELKLRVRGRLQQAQARPRAPHEVLGASRRQEPGRGGGGHTRRGTEMTAPTRAVPRLAHARLAASPARRC